jgi:hypothetical protein
MAYEINKLDGDRECGTQEGIILHCLLEMTAVGRDRIFSSFLMSGNRALSADMTRFFGRLVRWILIRSGCWVY